MMRAIWNNNAPRAWHGMALMLLAGCAPRQPGTAFDAGPLFKSGNGEFTHTFVVTNTTGRSVRIMDRLCSCVCTSSALDRSELAPGESTKLILRVNLLDSFQSLAIDCTLITDHPEFPQWPYRLTFRTYPRIRFASDLIDLGEVKAAQDEHDPEVISRDTWIETYCPASEPADELVTFENVNPPLEVSQAGESVVNMLESGRVRQTRYRATIHLRPRSDALAAARTETISVLTRAGTRGFATVSWRQLAPLAIAPTEVFFGVIDGNDPVKKTVSITSNEGRAFTISGPSEGRVSVHLPSQAREGEPLKQVKHKIELILSTSESDTAGAMVGEFILRTDHPGGAELRIPWSAFRRRPKQIGSSLQNGVSIESRSQ